MSRNEISPHSHKVLRLVLMLIALGLCATWITSCFVNVTLVQEDPFSVRMASEIKNPVLRSAYSGKNSGRLWISIVGGEFKLVWSSFKLGGSYHLEFSRIEFEPGFTRLPSFDRSIPAGRLSFPLWIPFVGALLVLFCLSRRWSSRESAQACANCGYDTTGNATGICPECGTNIASESTPVPQRPER
jgi:hypothetical protein